MDNKLSNVIIVDDDELVLKSLQRLLQSESYFVWVTASGPKALSLLSSRETAVLVSDHRMPGMSGIELLEEAKRISPDTLRILLTGFADVDLAREAVNRCGIYKLLFKPWDEKELKEAISSALIHFKHLKTKKRIISKSMNVFIRHLSGQRISSAQNLSPNEPVPETDSREPNSPHPAESPEVIPDPSPSVDDCLLHLG